MLLIFGDPHINDTKPWFIPATEAFIFWLENLPQNNSNNSVIFLGDMTESFMNTGKVFHLLNKMLQACKFKKVYVLVGNHDLKKHPVSGEHLTYEFVTELDSDRFKILRVPAQVLEIEGLNVLSLPHFSTQLDGISMKSYYENLPASILSRKYDLVIGHFLDDSVQTRMEPINLKGSINTKHTVLGHIHTSIGENYIGSLFPVKSNENGDRYYVIVDKENFSKLALPKFSEYIEVDYGSEIPYSQAEVKIHSIYGCSSLEQAKDLYGKELFYHKVFPYSKQQMKALFKNSELGMNASRDEFNILSNKKLTLPEVLSSYMKDNPQAQVGRATYSIILELPV